MACRVYIAGKVSGTDDYKERFGEAEQYLKSLGLEAVNPVDHTYDTWDYKMLFDRGMNMLRSCKMIALLPGFEDSPGARAELAYAKAVGMPVFDLDKRLVL